MKQYYLIFATILVIGIFTSSGCTQQVINVEAPEEEGEILIAKIPEEYKIFRDYLTIIYGSPGVSDEGTIEATILSITADEICPDEIEFDEPEPKGCSIEPYPAHFGTIRIDKIIDYQQYSEKTDQSNPQEESSEIEDASEGQSIPGNQGSGVFIKPRKPEYDPLKEGQVVTANFLLTTDPANIIHISLPPAESGNGLEIEKSLSNEPEQTAESPAGSTEPIPKIFKPITKINGIWQFTTKIIQYPETSQKSLPGLKVGDKFRAKIKYNGNIFVEEYQIV